MDLKKLGALYPAHLDYVKQRWDEALAATKFDSVVIFGGAQHMIFLDDMPYPFKVNAHLKWWAPVIDNPNCFIVYTPGEKPLLLYYNPIDFWHKVADKPESYWTSSFDIRYLPSLEEAKKEMPSGGHVALVGEPMALDKWSFGETNPKNLLEHIHYHRAKKTAYELECMREANRIGALGHIAAEKAFRAGATEYEIHLDYLRAIRHVEPQLPYGNIIALNEHASVLHYQHQSHDQPKKRNSFLIDAGAQFHGYASDITRTYAAERGEFQEFIDRNEKMQLELCDLVRPGHDYREIHLTTHRMVGEILREFELTTVDASEAVESGVTRAFFPHGVGHFIGLQVHDVGGFSRNEHGATIDKPENQPFLRLTRPIEVDQVFTIEPGIYFIDSLLEDLKKNGKEKLVNWKRVEQFRPYGGVRIEDDVVVKADGHENMTRDAFREAEGAAAASRRG
jgi:Xaa-Pro dipeptidase